MKEARAQKLAKYNFMIVYFIIVSFYGYQTFKDAPWLPKELGGPG
jgi:hypothetical protein